MDHYVLIRTSGGNACFGVEATRCVARRPSKCARVASLQYPNGICDQVESSMAQGLGLKAYVRGAEEGGRSGERGLPPSRTEASNWNVGSALVQYWC
jgi:hypothetical protein